jgi:hypothetical protein
VRRGHHLLLGFPLGVISAVLLWIGDMHLTHRDWGPGVLVFGAGLVFAFLCVRELRLGGIVR